MQILDVEQHVRRVGGALVDAQQHLAADHQPREALLGRPLGGQRLDSLTATEHRDAVGNLGHLVELVADEDDRFALRGQSADDLEELSRLLRRQHRRRLVEHEDVRVPIERLQDLDPLLLPHRDVLDARLRVDGETEPLGDVPHPVVGLADIEERAGVRRLGGEHDVLRHRHHRDQHEVLVHHPDAGIDRGLRRAELDRLARDHDLALVRVVQPVEDVHQRRLAGTVLTEQGVYFALTQVEVDVVVGHGAREALGDVAHLEHGSGGVGHRCEILWVWPPARARRVDLEPGGDQKREGGLESPPSRVVRSCDPLSRWRYRCAGA